MDKNILLEEDRIIEKFKEIYFLINNDLEPTLTLSSGMSEFIYLSKMIQHHYSGKENQKFCIFNPHNLSSYNEVIGTYKDKNFIITNHELSIQYDKQDFFIGKDIILSADYDRCKVNMSGMKERFKLKSEDFYTSDLFKNLYQDASELHDSLKETLEIYLFVENAYSENITEKKLEKFINKFKNEQKIFYMMLPVISFINNLAGINLVKKLIEFNVEISSAGMEAFYLDIEKKLHGYVPDDQIKKQILTEAKNINVIDKFKLTKDLQQNLIKNELEIVRKNKI